MKILYCLTSLAHKRVFQSFKERNEHEQMIVGPKPIIFDDIVPEDYSEFKIKNIKNYDNAKDIQNIVNDFKPNYYIQSDISPTQKIIKLPKNCKRIYVSHGLVVNYIDKIIKKYGGKDFWIGFDLYCGGTSIFKNWIKSLSVNEDKIIINAIPQFDILYDAKNSYSDSLKKAILSKTKNPNAEKVIFFGGFCCKDRADFLNHNEDYFKTCIELEKIARKNNWIVFVKPRQTFVDMKNFLIINKPNWGGWSKKYIGVYSYIQNSPYLQFIKTSSGLHYYYLISDSMIINGCSTIEVEAYSINKPLIVINTKPDSLGSDAFNISNFGARYNVDKIEDLEDIIKHTFNNPNEKTEFQKLLLSNMGLTFDGKMHERVFDKVIKI